MNIYKIFFTSLVLLASIIILANLPVFSQSSSFITLKDTSLFLLKLEETTKKIRTIQCDFVQEKYMSCLSEKIINKGHFCFKKDNLIRWEYLEPFEYFIIINNAQIYIKDEDKVNKYNIKGNKMFKEIIQFMPNSLQENILNNDNSKYKSEFFEDDKYYLVKLIPLLKNTKKFINNINIYFDKKDYSVSILKIVELSGDYTKINFHNKIFNKIIPDEIFVIK